MALPRCGVERFARLGAGLLERAQRQPEAPPLLVVAELTGAAILLGRHQRLTSALNPDRVRSAGLTVHRRSSGGRALGVGQGTVGVLLALPEMGALLGAPIPPDKVINRYVRGLLAGLTRAGVPGGARYFGRDFVSAQGQQLAVVAQDNGPRAALLEALVAVEVPLGLTLGVGGYPEHSDPRAAGPEPTTLAALRGSPTSFEELASAIAHGYASVHGCLLAARELPEGCEGALTPLPEEDEQGWSASGLCDIPIGFAEGLCRHDGARVLEARLRGDFIAPGFVIAGLERALVGLPLRYEALGAAVDAAFHQPGACIIGLSALRVFADALLNSL